MSKHTPDDTFDMDDEFDNIDDDLLLAAETQKVGSKRPCPNDPGDPPNKKTKKDDEKSVVSLAQSILNRVWGYSEFRHEQESAILRLISGESAVVIFPTGGGKSLVYQIPALAFDERKKDGAGSEAGVTLVVSPLIALMKDQVDALRKRYAQSKLAFAKSLP